MTLFATAMGLGGIGLASFLSFHLYLVSRGMTTNEYYKWKALSSASSTDKNKTAASCQGRQQVADEENGSVAAMTSMASSNGQRRNLYNVGIVENFRDSSLSTPSPAKKSNSELAKRWIFETKTVALIFVLQIHSVTRKDAIDR